MAARAGRVAYGVDIRRIHLGIADDAEHWDGRGVGCINQTGCEPHHLQWLPSCCAVFVAYYASFDFTGTASAGFCNLLFLSSLKLEARVRFHPSPMRLKTEDRFAV